MQSLLNTAQVALHVFKKHVLSGEYIIVSVTVGVIQMKRKTLMVCAQCFASYQLTSLVPAPNN
jgi:hypothetical protein